MNTVSMLLMGCNSLAVLRCLWLPSDLGIFLSATNVLLGIRSDSILVVLSNPLSYCVLG